MSQSMVFKNFLTLLFLSGGHPHEWKSISGVCITLLQEFVYRLNEYSFAAAATPAPEFKSVPSKSKY